MATRTKTRPSASTNRTRDDRRRVQEVLAKLAAEPVCLEAWLQLGEKAAEYKLAVRNLRALTHQHRQEER